MAVLLYPVSLAKKQRTNFTQLESIIEDEKAEFEENNDMKFANFTGYYGMKLDPSSTPSKASFSSKNSIKRSIRSSLFYYKSQNKKNSLYSNKSSRAEWSE